MPTAKVEPVNVNIVISTEALRESKLTLNEYAILEYIVRKQSDPESGFSGWCIVTKKEIADNLNLTQRSVFSILNKLLSKGLIERHDRTKFIRVTNLHILGNNFTHYEESSYILTKEKVAPKENIYINHTSPSEMEGRLKKPPSCPLEVLLGNKKPPEFGIQATLRVKYPNGHKECVEYLTSEEEDRGSKFINRSKQFMFIHKILRAGYGFDAMDKTIKQMDKRYGKGHWDYSNMANWLEKGAADG